MPCGVSPCRSAPISRLDERQRKTENAAPKEDNATANAVTSLTAALTKKALEDAESKDKDDAGHKDAARSE